MTATNHALTGALVAIAINNPVAIPIAFLAHFAMDAIPHFGVSEPDLFKKHRSGLFIKVLIIDSIFVLLALIFVPHAIQPEVPIWLTFLSMIACMSPDLVWGWHLYHEVVNKVTRKTTWFSKWHKKIQWKEIEWGALVEVAWACLCVWIITAVK